MSQATDDKKVLKAVDKIIKIMQKSNLNIPEILVVYGNLGYHLGASIAGFQTQESGPNLEEVKQAYYENPTVDTGLMLQGLLITTWEEDYIKQPRLSKLVKERLGEKE